MEQLLHKEDLKVFKYLDKATFSPMQIIIKPCIFGYTLIGTTFVDQLMAVELGSSLEELMINFTNRWNKANTSRSLFFDKKQQPDPNLVQSVLKAINEGSGLDFNIARKMSMFGTLFQRKVWQGLLDVPSGTTETYQQVANRIGDPKAVRAVANAIGANPIAVIIPCHRIVRSDGKMGGYRWGEDIKRKLLDREVV